MEEGAVSVEVRWRLSGFQEQHPSQCAWSRRGQAEGSRQAVAAVLASGALTPTVQWGFATCLYRQGG